MPKVLNIAVVGAGTMAQAIHLPLLRRRWDRFAVTALVDLSPRRRREAADVFGVPEDQRLTDVGELMAAVRAKEIEVDAVLLSTDGLHIEDLLKIIRRGIPVIVEPPLGFSEAEVRQVADFERMTGRRLVMMAYPQAYDDAVGQLGEHVKRRDVRMLDYEVLMPASQPLFGHAHVTSSAYDLDSELRSERRTALQEAVEAGSGAGATQRDRDLYVKGLLTGVAHQLAVVEQAYGRLDRIEAVRHWPRGVIPGSIEIQGRLEGDAPVRLVWHYLPFAPEYVERIDLLSARRRLRLDFATPSHLEERSVLSAREKQHGKVTETQELSTTGPVEAMWEAFHELVVKGTPPRTDVSSALAEVVLLREVLASIVEADGRSIDAVPEADDEDEADGASTDADGAADDSSGVAADAASADATDGERVTADAPTAETATIDGPATEIASVDASSTETASVDGVDVDLDVDGDAASRTVVGDAALVEPVTTESADESAAADRASESDAEPGPGSRSGFGASATEVGSAQVVPPSASQESAPIDAVAASDPAREDEGSSVRPVDGVIDPAQSVDTQDVWGIPEPEDTPTDGRAPKGEDTPEDEGSPTGEHASKGEDAGPGKDAGPVRTD